MADPQPDAVHVALVQTAATTDSAAQRATVAGWFERLRAAPGPALANESAGLSVWEWNIERPT